MIRIRPTWNSIALPKTMCMSSVLFCLCLLIIPSENTYAQVPVGTPPPLSAVPVPGPDNLAAIDPLLSSRINRTDVPYSEFVIDEAALVQLGKALFWDMQVGSDGIQACASCHFAGGADPRSMNALSPGLNAGDNTFQVGSPNYQLLTSDFPLHVKADPADSGSPVIRDANDVVSSQGMIGSIFNDIVPGSDIDDFTEVADDAPFNTGSFNTRRVEPRQTPSTINAVFNLRQFWDGRASNNFNGVNPFGNRDQEARVVRVGGGAARPVQILMPLSSLASQATGPPLSHEEMSAEGRTWAKIGKKLQDPSVIPLAGQIVDQTDSVLGPLSNDDGTGTFTGLGTTYAAMIEAAFHPQWVNGGNGNPVVGFNTGANGTPVPFIISRNGVPANTDEYTVMEANFSMFFGLAVQAYQQELVSDQSPFDAFAAGNLGALTAQQQRGLAIFLNVGVDPTIPAGRCVVCHNGSEFSSAVVSRVGVAEPIIPGVPPEPDPAAVIERMPTAFAAALASLNFVAGDVLPPDPGDVQLPLDFDPRGATIEIVGSGTNTVFFDGVFPGTPGPIPPPAPCVAELLTLTLNPQRALRGFANPLAAAEFVVDAATCGVNFDVLVEAAPVGVYDILVDGVFRGSVEVIAPAVYDLGFYNIAVRPTTDDIGVGGTDPFGNPLSFSEMELLMPGRDDIRDGLPGGGLGGGFEFNPPIGSLNETSDAAGAFKTPILRNVALTAPYMHNGGMSTLQQVMEFYNRGGDFPLVNLQTLDPDIAAIGMTQQDMDDLISFMESLTDPRVATQAAPFDHPQLMYPDGHSSIDGITVFDEAVAVGAAGGVPIEQFLENGPASASKSGGLRRDMILAAADDDYEQPTDYSLDQNYPNPFNPTTTIRFSLANSIQVQLEIYNMLGQRVKTLVNNEMSSGWHAVSWDGTNDSGEQLASGIYIYRLNTPNFEYSRQMSLTK
ncbi:MAG: cytochrome c peroxidase [Rhodothermales bacterium]